jgi:hypothetical protein
MPTRRDVGQVFNRRAELAPQSSHRQTGLIEPRLLIDAEQMSNLRMYPADEASTSHPGDPQRAANFRNRLTNFITHMVMLQ